MKCFKRIVLILWFVLMTARVVFSSNDGHRDESDQPRNKFVKRAAQAPPSSCQVYHGSPGRDGQPGKPGRPGPPGPPGGSSSTGGVVYTRWGRKHCRGTWRTVEIYSGVMGGSYYNDAGGGSNYLCLPLNPIYKKYTDGLQLSTFIHASEYKTLGDQYKIFPQRNLHNKDPPCAVCHAKSRGSHMMIPARNVCPSGWTMEYKGYLMAERYNHKRTQFICVDGEPEATHGSHRHHYGAFLYFVESACTHGLPCPPYIHGRELTCVVCTQ